MIDERITVRKSSELDDKTPPAVIPTLSQLYVVVVMVMMVVVIISFHAICGLIMVFERPAVFSPPAGTGAAAARQPVGVLKSAGR